MAWPRLYTYTLARAIRWRYITAGLGLLCLAATLWLASYVGSEFLPHLDEGAVWVRGTPPSTFDHCVLETGFFV